MKTKLKKKAPSGKQKSVPSKSTLRNKADKEKNTSFDDCPF